MSTTNEPRALTAALQSPAFVTKGGGLAMHVADRHVERWAPEAGASRSRPLRNLGFVDRLVSPWIESAQRSASLRMFSQYISSGVGERPAQSQVSWVFPRPWYQDELDWMAAARVVGTQTAMQQSPAPSMFTTRGTYVAPAQAPQTQVALPSALYEYVAPSLSIARPDAPQAADAYSPLVPLAAANAAHVMSRAVAPIVASTPAARIAPGLRAVLSTMLERTALATPEPIATRTASYAPELVTPPAPRPEGEPLSPQAAEATQVAERYAEQHARIAELQRVTRVVAEREAAARAEARAPELRAAEAQRQAEIQQRAAEIAARRESAEAAVRRDAERTNADVERARIEARIAQRVAERERQEARLHESAREAAARDARIAPIAPSVEARQAAAPAPAIASEVAAAVAALPPELATMVAAGIGQRPERAAQAIAELGEALRAVELMARTAAAGGTFESSRGPRLVMPAGLGGLVATVERTTGPSLGAVAAQARVPAAFARAPQPILAPQAFAPRAEIARVPAMPFLAAPNATAAPMAMRTTSALGAAEAATPAALQHVAWSDRWLARFAGARPQSLDVLAAASAPETRLSLLAAAAPRGEFVAPDAAADKATEPARAAEVVRFDDSAETPDDVLFAIAAAATKTRATAAAPAQPQVQQPEIPRETIADLVAHSVPSAPGAGLSAQLASSPFAPALRHVLPLAAAPTFDVRALFGSGIGATYLAGLVAASADEIPVGAFAPGALAAMAPMTAMAAPMFETGRDVADWQPTYVAPESREVEAPAGEQLAGETVEPAAARAELAQLTTLRSALLSFDVESIAAAQAGAEPQARVAATSVASAPLAHSLIEALSLPMAVTREASGSSITDAASYMAPGMIADRAQSWSVAQERSTSDLAYDFVTPELVLAARVYGLGPAEAAQAARLAIAGPGQLGAMASAVDRTFVQAMAIEAERRGERTRALTTAYPLASGDTATVSRPAAALGAEPAETAAAPEAAAYPFAPSGTAFGIERRMPRGAFLWPAATTAALGLNAAAPDGELSMSVAALELLAAQSVAELGTYAALGELRGESIADARGTTASSAAGGAAAAEPSDDDVLASASAYVPASRRDKFQALFLALGQSPSGKTVSPAARAARALALAGRGDESITARERASVAWDVLPVVYGMTDEQQPLSTGEAAVRAERRREELRSLDPMFVDARPGLGMLSARAGEALGSYVAPAAPGVYSASSSSSSSSSSSYETGAVLRAPTAAQELVQTGRPSGRHGGGEAEIPAWFEQAARKMLAEQSGVAGDISLAELTFVTAAPTRQIAAASRGDATAAAPARSGPDSTGGGGAADKQKVDIEKLANEVYQQVLVLMDTARARNGEPYL